MKASPFDILNVPREVPAKKRLSEMSKSERLEFTKANGRRGGMSSARDKEALSLAGKLGAKARHSNGR